MKRRLNKKRVAGAVGLVLSMALVLWMALSWVNILAHHDTGEYWDGNYWTMVTGYEAGK